VIRVNRDQHNQVKNKANTKWYALFGALLVIIILLFTIFFKLNSNAKSTPIVTRSTTSESRATSSQTATSQPASTETNTSVTSNQSSQSVDSSPHASTEPHPYAVHFAPGSAPLFGYYGSLPFALNIQNTDIMLSYNSNPNYPDPAAHFEERALLTPVTIETTEITVFENSAPKTVKVNTELVLVASAYPASSDFFTPFNGNHTDIFAYYTTNGQIALAFTPARSAYYQVVHFAPK
jgi:hypothetical protein